MTTMRPKVGKYSTKRTARGNVQTGRIHGKTNARIARDMRSTVSLFKGDPAKEKHFRASGRLALKREAHKLRA